MRRGILLFLFVLCLGAVSRDLFAQSPGVGVFVSTQGGNQILKVDGNLGTVSVISTGLQGLNLSFVPEAMVVGPDGKLYITDPTDGLVARMNQDGTQAEIIYRRNCNLGCPFNPQGPSFNPSSTADLYFNTSLTGNTHDGVWVMTGVGATPFGASLIPPVNVVPGSAVCGTPACFTPDNGAGTAFDSADSLLFGAESESALHVGCSHFCLSRP